MHAILDEKNIVQLESMQHADRPTGLRAKNSYTPSQLEAEVQEGKDAFLIKDSFLYFSMVECDVNWLMSQATIVVDHPNEFIVQDVLAYVLNKISAVDPESVDKQTLKKLFKGLKDLKLTE